MLLKPDVPNDPKLPLTTVCYRVAWLSKADSAAWCNKITRSAMADSNSVNFTVKTPDERPPV